MGSPASCFWYQLIASFSFAFSICGLPIPPVSSLFWRHLDFFIFANSISQDHISDLWTGIFSLGSHFLHRISYNICLPLSALCSTPCSKMISERLLSDRLRCKIKLSPHKFLAALNSVWNIKPVSSEHSIKCWRIQLLQVYKIVWWLCLQCMAKDNYSWQERGLEICPTLKPCQGCRIKE